jgi:hypothetical protein
MRRLLIAVLVSATALLVPARAVLSAGNGGGSTTTTTAATTTTTAKPATTTTTAKPTTTTTTAKPTTTTTTGGGCPAEKICFWNQPNFTGKMVVQERGQCQRPPDAGTFGVIRSVQNKTTKKPDGGEWHLHLWSADDCGCSKSCAEGWNNDIRAGEQRSDLNPGQKSYEAVFVEPDGTTS